MKHVILSIVLVMMLSACAGMKNKPDLLSLREEANSYYQQGDYESALAVYTELVEHAPEDAELWFKKGNIHVRLKQPVLAIEAYQASVSRDPRYFKAWYNLSRTHLKQAGNTLTQMLSVLPPSHELYEDVVTMTRNALDVLKSKPNNAASDADSATAPHSESE